MKKLRIIAVVLAILSLMMVFAACANNPSDGPSETTPTPSGDTSDPGASTTPSGSASAETTVSALGVPEDLKYTGKTYTIFTWSNQTQWEWDSEGIAGELIGDAIYERVMSIEEKFGITLNIQKQAGEWENRNSFIQAVAASVMTNAHAYDLIGQYTPAAAIGAMQNLYVDINDVDYVDLNSTWWPGDIAESSAINGKLYFVTGDITPTLVRNMGTVMVNLTKADELNLDNLYEIVDAGNWTMDELKKMALGHFTDLNGDDQIYAVTIANNTMFDNLFYGAGFKYVTPEADGTLSMSADLSGEKLINWFKSCQSLLNDNPDVEVKGITAAFSAEKALFHLGSVADVQNTLKDVEFDFGILPFPKYDTTQKDYATIVGYWVTMYSVPIDAPDQTMSGAVLETLGWEGATRLTPVVYEEAFQYRYLNSPENARMFDLLHDTLVYDTGRFFADQVACFSAFRQAASPTVDWSSFVKGQQKLWKRNVTTIYEELG